MSDSDALDNFFAQRDQKQPAKQVVTKKEEPTITKKESPAGLLAENPLDKKTSKEEPKPKNENGNIWGGNKQKAPVATVNAHAFPSLAVVTGGKDTVQMVQQPKNTVLNIATSTNQYSTLSATDSEVKKTTAPQKKKKGPQAAKKPAVTTEKKVKKLTKAEQEVEDLMSEFGLDSSSGTKQGKKKGKKKKR
mmetsp:Transcript_11556/g.18163  ORF Transcript_11556/g.18163 Transcript_11556/m.18163 type:complete len:191 (+) Transcript_11556:48-620(+)|eukprot:CAMPEP_0117029322 /NCGR_PEP_ID=MMETSP0472-20121206/21243_1 /TAXON_ID=693140 ORGANISM="Tiarina fusus, Strain LIS" /NCGR_SAMPLE_ID=MMETSP0472 /ASSEMBLY_ACC=CAM_ASM_000603 /LENGTH=190 /DNA_ID=CAMNT_0004737057 /DNA_START=41 /DNA_END=613 /DNA_ORIENTATION=+